MIPLIIAGIFLFVVVIAILIGTDTIYINSDGLVANLNSMTGKSATPIGGGTLRLFTSPTTVSDSTVIGSMTEATFTGYAGVALTESSWATAVTSGGVASSTYGAAVTFTRSATGTGQTVYGWYITDAGNTKLYASALFANGPYTLANNGDSVTVTPTLTDQSLN
jgi:hypothetical protein